MSQTQTLPIEESALVGQINNYFFTDNLVCAISGFHIIQLPENRREEIANECQEIFKNFIIDYVTEKHGAKSAWRLKASQAYNGNKIFDTFESLGNQYYEAYQVFVNILEQK